MSVPVYTKSELGPLARRMRELWKMYDWTLSNLEFEAWRQHLHQGKYLFSDLHKSVFDYTHCHEKGQFKPAFIELKPLLRKHKLTREGRSERKEDLTYKVSQEGKDAIEKIKAMLKNKKPLTPEESNKLYDELTRRR